MKNKLTQVGSPTDFKSIVFTPLQPIFTDPAAKIRTANTVAFEKKTASYLIILSQTIAQTMFNELNDAFIHSAESWLTVEEVPDVFFFTE